MKRVLLGLKRFFIHPEDIRISIFNVMAAVGGLVSFFLLIISFFNGATTLNLAALMSCFFISAALLAFSKKTGRYRICYYITIFAIFVVMFPLMFFTAGGLQSGMPVYFVFAVSYTVFMLENCSGLILSAFEIAEYVVCCVTAMKYPDLIIPFESEEAVATDIISCIIVCSIAMAVTVYIQAKLYHSQQKKTEEALEEVSRQSKAKDVFLANMSHEIRTPINMILGMSEMIERTATDEQVLEYNGKIGIFGQKLLTMIKDLLDITKIRTGQTELASVPYSLEEVVNELSMLGNELAGQKNITMDVRRDFDDDLTLIGDKEHLLQILSNLVSNAVKYTEKGGVTLTADAQHEKDAECTLTVTVEDTGIGIHKDEIPHIYDIFYRVNTQGSRSVEGTGIGLAIVKELADRMGGTLSLKSMVGVGTVFTFSLKQQISSHTVTEQSCNDTHYIAPDCRVLAVDDNPENLQLLKTLLSRTMLRIDTAENGADGIRLASKNAYDIIILDYMMPDMDGIETISLMKERGIEATFIALTADAIAGTGIKMTEAGFDEYVTKPVDWKKFEQTLLKYIPKDKLAFESSRQAEITNEQINTLTSGIEHCELDIRYGLRRVDNSFDIYRKILLLFCSHYSNNYNKASEVYEKCRWNELESIMHFLKAQAKGIGGTLLFRMAEAMEQKLKLSDHTYTDAAFPLVMLQWERTQEHALLISEIIPKTDEDTENSSIQTLTEKAEAALRSNLWLDAREAVEALQKKDGQNADYSEILQLVERFEFKEALVKLQNRSRRNE